MKNNFFAIILGIILGLFAPLLAIYLFYVFTNPTINFQEYFNHLLRFKLVSHILSIGAIANLLVFFIFIWTNKLYVARGVLFATVFYAILVAIAKII